MAEAQRGNLILFLKIKTDLAHFLSFTISRKDKSEKEKSWHGDLNFPRLKCSPTNFFLEKIPEMDVYRNNSFHKKSQKT